MRVLITQAARQAEQELNNLRQRIEELERGSGLGRALTPRRGSDMAQKDAMTLLQSAYVKVAKLCGIEVRLALGLTEERALIWNDYW